MTNDKTRSIEPKTSERVRVTLPVSAVEVLRREAESQDRPVANLVYTFLKESPSFQKVMKKAGRPVRGGRR